MLETLYELAAERKQATEDDDVRRLDALIEMVREALGLTPVPINVHARIDQLFTSYDEENRQS